MAKDAPRVAREIPFDPSVPGWTSTGLYAAPGEVITVIAPPSLIGRGLSVRLGAHSDKIWHLPEWQRWPEITRAFAIDSDRILAAAGAGGLIYICSPGGPAVSGAVIHIEGAVEAPCYRRGVTTAEAWRRQRQAPAPWGELAGDRIILTLPSDRLRSLEDPAAVVTLWDRVLDACADLAALPHEGRGRSASSWTFRSARATCTPAIRS